MDYHSYEAEDFAADESFLAYYLANDEAAVKFWKEWISHHPEKLDEIYNAEQLLSMLYLRLPDEELHLELARFDHFINAADTQENNFNLVPHTNKVKFWLSVLSAFLIIFSASVFLWIKSDPDQPQKTYVTRQTSYGKILIVWLTDGTKITLNANSSLKYPKTFTGSKRDVYLIGEAFFEVSRDSTRQFVVTAGETKTIVFGTQFNVNAYPENKKTEIALLKGSVAVIAGAKHTKIQLQPNQKAVFEKGNGHLSSYPFNAGEGIAWKTGTLVFKEAGFDEIASKMKNIYGITLVNSTHSGQWKYTGTFTKTDYLSVVKNICFARNLKFSQYKQTIILQ